MNRSWVRFPQAARSAPGVHVSRGFRVPCGWIPKLSCGFWHIRHPLCVRAMHALRAAAFQGCCVAKYRYRGGCVRGSWAGGGMIFLASWGGGVSFPVVVTLLAERILDPRLSILWKVLRCGSVDLRIPPVGRASELDECGLYGRALWGSPMETSALSQFSSLPEGCLEGVLR